MDCPYCEAQVKDYEEFNLHVLKRHPDKTSLEDVRQIRINRFWDTSANLTTLCFNSSVSHDKSDVLNTFKYFLRNLMESE